MNLKMFARWTGIVFLLLGIAGFFTETLFGLFHLSGIHNIIHLAIGALGLLAASQKVQAMMYARGLGIVYLLMGILGVFVPDLFGLMHVGMSDNLLHLIVGAVSLYIGYVSIESLNVSKAS